MVQQSEWSSAAYLQDCCSVLNFICSSHKTSLIIFCSTINVTSFWHLPAGVRKEGWWRDILWKLESGRWVPCCSPADGFQITPVQVNRHRVSKALCDLAFHLRGPFLTLTSSHSFSLYPVHSSHIDPFQLLECTCRCSCPTHSWALALASSGMLSLRYLHGSLSPISCHFSSLLSQAFPSLSTPNSRSPPHAYLFCALLSP